MHAGSHANQALLAPALPSLIHHATSVSDAADAAIAILRDNPALCESIPRLTIRAAVRAPQRVSVIGREWRMTAICTD